MKDLRGQVVLITGAGGGFGQELTRLLLEAGSLLILADLRAGLLRDALAAVTARFPQPPPGRVLGLITVDLSTPAGAEALYQQCRAISPHVDILVNNAGIAQSGPFYRIPADRWERLMQINLLAPMRLTALFLPDMIARRSGHIVNIASVAGIVGVANLAPYCGSKFGLRGFSEALYADVRRHGVDVTAIYPFFARTPILKSEAFGDNVWSLPDWLITDPAQTMVALVEGIRRRKLHVYPDGFARTIDIIRRIAPWAIHR